MKDILKPILPKPEDIAYAAGLFEGEGTICATISRTKHKNGTTYRYKKIELKIAMTDKMPLELFQEIFGVGYINTAIADPRGNRKTVYVYSIGKYDYVKFIVDAIYYWLSPRRQEQCDNALTNFKENNDRYSKS